MQYTPLFSRCTPLNFFFVAGFSTAMNSADILLRLVWEVIPPSFVFNWVRFTAPFHALSPTGFHLTSTLRNAAPSAATIKESCTKVPWPDRLLNSAQFMIRW
jgi:hypothetical protein